MQRAATLLRSWRSWRSWGSGLNLASATDADRYENVSEAVCGACLWMDEERPMPRSANRSTRPTLCGLWFAEVERVVLADVVDAEGAPVVVTGHLMWWLPKKKGSSAQDGS